VALYLARHAETAANREGVILGQSDAPLTASGVLSAQKMGRLLAGRGVICILTSPLGRARTSAEIMARHVGVEPVLLADLAELSCGRFEGRPRKEVLENERSLRSSWTDRPPGGESYRDAEGRAARAIGVIEKELGRGPVLVVGHAVFNRVLLKLYCGLDPGFAIELIQPHDLIYRVGRLDQKFPQVFNPVIP
jgi:broad specificity phosphatase PhoE